MREYFRARAERSITVDIDKDGSGQISREEFERYDKEFDEKVQKRVSADMVTFNRRRGNLPSVPVTSIEEVWKPIPPPPPEPGEEPRGKFLLRLTSDDFDKPLKDAKAAVFSFTRDLDTDADIWQAHGVLGYRYRVRESPRLTLMPSLEFDRQTGTGGIDESDPDDEEVKEVNKLVPRLQGEWWVYGDGKVFDLHQFRLNAAYATDFDWESKVPAIEFQWEPIAYALRIGPSTPLAKWLQVRWKFIGHVEYGRTVDGGGIEALEKIEDEDFLRVGPIVEVELIPTGALLERFTFTLRYEHRNDVLNDYHGEDLFTALSEFQLDKNGNFFLSLEYRHGDVPLVEQRVNAFLIGLGVKF